MFNKQNDMFQIFEFHSNFTLTYLKFFITHNLNAYLCFLDYFCLYLHLAYISKSKKIAYITYQIPKGDI